MNQIKMLSLTEVVASTTLSKSTIERRIKAGLFPAKVVISERRRAFRASDIDAYLQNCSK